MSVITVDPKLSPVFAPGDAEVVFIAAAISDKLDASVFAGRIIDRKTWAVIAEENGLTIPETCARFRRVFDSLRDELIGE